MVVVVVEGSYYNSGSYSGVVEVVRVVGAVVVVLLEGSNINSGCSSNGCSRSSSSSGIF